MSKDKHNWMNDFQFQQRKSSPVVAAASGKIEVLRSWLSNHIQIIPAVAEALDLCSTRAKFQRRFRVSVGPSDRALKPIIEGHLCTLLQLPTTVRTAEEKGASPIEEKGATQTVARGSRSVKRDPPKKG